MKYLTKQDFDQTIASGVTLVDFYAEWCGPCKILGKLMPHLSEKYAGKAIVAKVDTDTEFELAQKHGITALPTVIIFKDGEQVERVRGLLPPEKYSELLDKHIA